MANPIDKSEVSGRQWVLILGGSRGLGYATAQKYARHGYNLIIIHRDRKADLSRIKASFKTLAESGIRCETFNCDAMNPVKREEVLDSISGILNNSDKIHTMVHSIAKGNLKPMTGGPEALSHQDLVITLDAMAVSLYDWSRALIGRGFFAGDARIISFTSEGNKKALKGYGAVAAAKAALEALSRNMALEFAPFGIRVNCIQAGVTETDSFSMIPGSDRIKALTLKRNPFGRLTLPSDVADVAYLLGTSEAAWITGTIIKADGGESLS
jgi:enoyl-[acyl-carrier protein] reductase III